MDYLLFNDFNVILETKRLINIYRKNHIWTWEWLVESLREVKFFRGGWMISYHWYDISIFYPWVDGIVTILWFFRSKAFWKTCSQKKTKPYVLILRLGSVFCKKKDTNKHQKAMLHSLCILKWIGSVLQLLDLINQKELTLELLDFWDFVIGGRFHLPRAVSPPALSFHFAEKALIVTPGGDPSSTMF